MKKEQEKNLLLSMCDLQVDKTVIMSLVLLCDSFKFTTPQLRYLSGGILSKGKYVCEENNSSTSPLRFAYKNIVRERLVILFEEEEKGEVSFWRISCEEIVIALYDLTLSNKLNSDVASIYLWASNKVLAKQRKMTDKDSWFKTFGSFNRYIRDEDIENNWRYSNAYKYVCKVIRELIVKGVK